MLRLHIVVILLVATVACTVGCGAASSEPAGSTATPTAPSGSAIVTNTLPSGARDPAVNLIHLLSESAPRFHRVTARCPEVGDPPDYPFSCRLTAIMGKQRVDVTGTATVYGVYRPTLSYIYETSWRPRR